MTAIGIALAALGVGIAQGATGDLSQSAGPAGCLAAFENGCRVAKSPRGFDLATSPDGRHLYVSSGGNITTLEVARDGSLRQSPKRYSCLSDFFEPCRALPRGGEGITGIAISPDGRHVYLASNWADGVLVLERDPDDGSLRQLAGTRGCISTQGRSQDSDPATAGDCTDAPSLADVASIAISPDGRDVYVGSGFTADSISILDRNSRTGALSQREGETGCVSEVIAACRDSVVTDLVAAMALDSKGRHLYAASHNGSGIAVFDRAADGSLTQKPGDEACVTHTGAPSCENGRALGNTRDLAVSPDDRHLYAVSRFNYALTTFDRSGQDGTIDQRSGPAGCLVEAAIATPAGCGEARLLGVANNIAVSRDGRNVYVQADGFFAENTAHGISNFRRNPQTGALTQPAGPAGCFSLDGLSDPDDPGTAGDCRDGRLFGPFGEMVLSRGDGALYSNDTNVGIDVLSRQAKRCGGKRVTIMGTPLKDRLRGSSGKDVISGLAGKDRIKGLAGKDVLCGGKDRDRLNGAAGKDTCRGQAGRDRLKSCEKAS